MPGNTMTVSDVRAPTDPASDAGAQDTAIQSNGPFISDLSLRRVAYSSTSKPVGTGTFSLFSFSPAASATVSSVAAKSFSR